MKLLIFVCFTVLFYAESFAQENLLKAKIFAVDNTVTEVYIKKNFPKIIPQSFDYSINGSEPFQTIKAASIKRIEFKDGTVFENYFIKVPVIYNDYMNRQLGDYQNQENWLSDNVLIEKVIDGAINLYLFIDKYEYEHFFYKKQQDTVITYISNTTYVTESYLNEDRSLKMTIKELSMDYHCSSSLNQKIEKLKYEQPVILNMFRELNACAGTPVEIKSYENRVKDKFRFGILGGVAFPKVKNSYYLNRTVTPIAGAYIEVTPGRGYENYFLDVEAWFLSYKSERPLVFASGQGKVDLKFLSINIDPSARIFFKKPPDGFFLKTGANFRWIVMAKQTLYEPGAANRYADISKVGLELGVLGGAGYVFKKFSLQAQYGLPLMLYNYNYNFFCLTARIELVK